MRRLYRFKLAESPQQERQFVNDNLVFPESTLPDPMDEAVEREREAFIALHPMLLANYPGEEVAIYQGQIVDHDQDGVALSSRIYQRFPHEFVWIAPVTDQPLEVRTVYSHHREPEWQ